MKENDLVILNFNHNRILNNDMNQWMIDNKETVFKVEKIYKDSVKLRKIDFWISKDLLKIKE